MSKLIEKIIATGAIPAHAPGWAKMSDVQWIQKLDNILEHPNKYRDSILKRTLVEEANKLKPLTRYPLICGDILEAVKAWNQIPDYVIRFRRWYAIYPDGHQEYICPIGNIIIDSDKDIELD